jgi:RecB family exonuclease
VSGRHGAPEREAARALGALVHRAVAAGALTAPPERRAALVASLGALLDDSLRATALAAVTRLADRPEVRALISESDVQHEVPLSWRADDGTTLRAVVDAVVRHPAGGITLVEFKTGAPRDADARQLQAYVDGVRRLVPDIPVDGRIIRLDS